MKELLEIKIKNYLNNLGFSDDKLIIQSPKNTKFGDFSTNIALIISKENNKNPMEIANLIKSKAEEETDFFDNIKIIKPGFINFFIHKKIFFSQLQSIITSNEYYGKSNIGNNKNVLVEFVSANPTGPLTIGHGRGAILGDVVCNILEWNGYNINREYYFNNAGKQMNLLGESVYARYCEYYNINYDFPEQGYKGEYIKDIAKKISNSKGKEYINNPDNHFFSKFAETEIFNDIQNTLKILNLKFDNYFNEYTLYENDGIDNVVKKLKKKKLLYEKDGATWIKTSELGRQNDKVLIKSSGEPTYRLPDIAYHIDKFERKYDLIIDVFGADHNDTYPDVLAAVKALKYNTNKVKTIIHQFVTITENNKPAKMSTRKANFISLKNLAETVGIDVLRYFFIMRSSNNHLNFDLEIAKDQSDNNPVFYLQYAHARIYNVLKRSKTLDLIKNEKVNYNLLSLSIENEIMKKLLEFPDIVAKCSITLEPQNISNFLQDLAALFHKYYANERIIDNNNLDQTYARLQLISAIKIIIKNGLTILGINCPNQM